MKYRSALAKAIVSARDILSTKTWTRGSYFSYKGDTLCMCAHGALQSQVNPIVKNIIDRMHPATVAAAAATAAAADLAADLADAAAAGMAAARAGAARAAVAAAAATARASDKSALRDAWNKRPCWVSKNTTLGNLDAHFIFGLVGLTANYNDLNSTSLRSVKKKMTEAAKLADELCKESA